MTDKPPALEGTMMSNIVGKHIQVLHAYRTVFTKSECSERIRRALRKQIRPSGICFQLGDRVYYKCPNGKEWKGPGTVIGQNGVVIFVRHGGMMIRVHQCRLTKTVETLEKDDKKSVVKENLNLELPNMGNIETVRKTMLRARRRKKMLGMGMNLTLVLVMRIDMKIRHQRFQTLK